MYLHPSSSIKLSDKFKPFRVVFVRILYTNTFALSFPILVFDKFKRVKLRFLAKLRTVSIIPISPIGLPDIS